MNKEQFIEHLDELNIKITENQLFQLEKYYEMLVRENKLYNLTTITDKEQVYLKHFYDSITLIKIVNLSNQKICDMGTGAGFPGLVLKIIFPNLQVTLIDATLKKCKFLEMVIEQLELKGINVINKRIEEYAKEEREKYDIVVSRAVAPLKHLLEYGIPLLKISGVFVAMKSNIEKELINIDNYLKKLYIKLEKKEEFLLPIENSNRTLISYIKTKKTDLKYPRKYSEIKKREL